MQQSRLGKGGTKKKKKGGNTQEDDKSEGEDRFPPSGRITLNLPCGVLYSNCGIFDFYEHKGEIGFWEEEIEEGGKSDWARCPKQQSHNKRHTAFWLSNAGQPRAGKILLFKGKYPSYLQKVDK